MTRPVPSRPSPAVLAASGLLAAVLTVLAVSCSPVPDPPSPRCGTEFQPAAAASPRPGVPVAQPCAPATAP